MGVPQGERMDSVGQDGEEQITKTVVRNTPWVMISIAVHAIVIAYFSVQYLANERKGEQIQIQSIQIKETSVADVVEPPPEEVRREEIPEIPDEDVEPVVNFEDPAVEDPAGREDLENPTTNPDGAPIPGDGFTGSTSIGVGVGGHEGLRVSPQAGKLGNGGGLGNGKYGDRNKGGNHKFSKVIAEALEWLARHQDPKGYWSCGGFSGRCQENKCSGDGDASHDVGATGLALLAFLGAGQTLTVGTFRDNVARATQYLAEIQDPTTGRFGDETGAQGYLYDQALAALAMCEAYGLSGNPSLKKVAQKAVNYCQSARNPYKAWRYSVPGNGENDMSVTGWMVMVLRSAKDFGLAVDDAAFDGAKLVIDELTDLQTGRTGYISRGGLSAREPGFSERWPAGKVEAMTAVAMLSRIFMGQEPENTPELRLGADLLKKSLPSWDENSGVIDYYYWYYGSFAMFQMGGKDWETWESKIVDVIKTHQEDKGCERGSWNPSYDPWGARGGRVYSTALLCLCAEVHHRYARVIGAREH
jgi:hypothetical protein